jgi:lipopolysaccharide export system permease protein
MASPLEFFPSRTLTTYLGKMFATRIVAVLLMLVLILQMLDLLGESGKILAYPGNSEEQIWTYISLRVPQLVARFLPYSVLLATILSLATLNQNSEVIAMKASGLSAHQVLAPLFLVATVVTASSFVFNESVVTHANATLKAWQAVEYGPLPRDSATRNNVFLRDGPNVLSAATINGEGTATVMERVTWYRRDAAGMIVEQIRSPRATYAAPGWRLEAPVAFDVASAEQRSLPPMVLAHEVTPLQLAISNVDADAENVFHLSGTITALRDAGRRTSELEGKWWHRFSGPLSAMLMPLLGAIAGFGLARSGQLLLRSVIGMALGFAYFVIDNAALAMGNFGGYPPMVAAWAPFLLFLLIGETVLIRTEE